MPKKIPDSEHLRIVDALLTRLESAGLQSLSPVERATLAHVALGDPRTARLLPVDLSNAAPRTELCRSIRSAWLDEEWHVVIDYRERLRSVVAQVDDPKYPIASLILYATWFEHTLNIVCIRQGLLRGLNSDQVDSMVRRAPLESKLGWLTQILGLPAFDSEHTKRVLRLAEVRNEFVHYKWRGYLPADHQKQLQKLRDSVANLEPVLDYFLTYYRENLEEPYVAAALDTFRIDRGLLDANA